MITEFYKRASSLDKLKRARVVQNKDVLNLIERLHEKALYRYFFDTLSNDRWIKNRLFREFLVKELSSDDDIKPRYVVDYLNLLSTKCSLQVYDVLRKSSIKEQYSKGLILKSLLNIDIKYSVKLVPLLIKLVGSIGDFDLGVITQICIKWLKANRTKESMRLFETIIRPIQEKELPVKLKGIHGEARSKHDAYYVREFCGKIINALSHTQTVHAFRIIKFQLNNCLRIEQRINRQKYTEDFSWIWRPAIEEHEQNIGMNNLKEILAVSLRDVLEKIAGQEYNKLRMILEELKSSRYSIFNRLAIHIVRLHIDEYIDLANQYALVKKNLDDPRIRHEYFTLLGQSFNKLNSTTRQQLLKWIDKGPNRQKYINWVKKHEKEPTEDQIQRYIDQWRIERLWVIKDHIPERKEEIEHLREKVETPKHPDFASWSEETIGFKSSYSIEDLNKADDEQLLQYLRKPLIPPNERHYPFVGFSRTFTQFAQENIDRVINCAESLNDDEIHPIFLEAFFRGLEEGLKKKPEGNITKLQPLIEYVVGKNKSLPEKEDAELENDKGTYSSVCGSIANYIEAIMRKKECRLTEEEMRFCRDVLLRIVDDPDPTKEHENKYGPPNMDWPTLSMNATSGKALHAIVHYALRYSQMRGGVKPRLESVVKERLTAVLSTDHRLSVRSVFGMYLANLWYLDEEWIKNEINILFPEANDEEWEAVWDAYIAYNDLYKDIYDNLGPQYVRAIGRLENMSSRKQTSRHFSKHIALIYWRNWEVLDGDSILNLFYLVAPIEARMELVNYIGLGLRNEVRSGNDKSDSNIWLLPRNLWEWRLAKAKESGDKANYSGEINTFLGWLDDVPESIDTLYPLIADSIEFLSDDIRTGQMLDYLVKNSDMYPLETVKILKSLVNTIVEGKAAYWFSSDEISKLLESALAKGGEAKEIARTIANKFGEIGDFRYKSIWEKSQQ